jgi:cytochrome c553
MALRQEQPIVPRVFHQASAMCRPIRSCRTVTERISATAAALFSIVMASAMAAKPPPQTALCTTCYGANGVDLTPDAPHIAGQPSIYLVAQLHAFRGGTRA